MRKFSIAVLVLASALPALAQDTEDLLALVAMPLVVDEVSEMTDVPQDRVAQLLEALTGIELTPRQYVRVVEYAPVALVYDDETGDTDLVRFINETRAQNLDRNLFYDRVVTYYTDSYGFPVDAFNDETVWLTDGTYLREGVIPATVTTVVGDIRRGDVDRREVIANADWSSHPHGGPPGQLKKELGLKTGAEVVHGDHPGRADQRGGPAGNRASSDVRDQKQDRNEARSNDKGKPDKDDKDRGKGKKKKDNKGNKGNKGNGNGGVR